ncbi:MAG TPA: hypothetical protein VN598_12015 [Usitatibacter sp.]|nr:hypothetical protein [Usitatibacter sp.]
MNRLTAIGLASLVAYGLLIASKYTGIVSAAREDKAASSAAISDAAAMRALTGSLRDESAPMPVKLGPPIALPERLHVSTGTLEFRAARDLKSFADGLNARRGSLSGDERYNLARALEECQFATTINEDIAAYSAKQRRAFLAGLTPGDPNAAKRIAAYDAADNTQRCLRFQGSRISQKDIEDLYAAAAQQGDPRAQARLLVAELNAKNSSSNRTDQSAPATTPVRSDDMSKLVGLLETQDPEAMLIVGNFLAQSSIATQLHIGPNGEVPEPAAFLGAFSLVACDMTSDCQQLSRDPQLACAFSGYCDAQTFEELYQNFLASPWAYAQASRYRNIIHTAIDTQNWSLIGITPQTVDSAPNGGAAGGH